MNDAEHQTGTVQDVALPIEGALDLGYVRQHVRRFLSGVDELLIADAVLVAVMLSGDACRYGEPPITLRLRRLAGGSSLRIEVEDGRQGPPDPLPEDSRTSILDRLALARGLDDHDGTITWAEVALTAG